MLHVLLEKSRIGIPTYKNLILVFKTSHTANIIKTVHFVLSKAIGILKALAG